MTTLALNLYNQAISQYTDYDYNTLGVFQGTPIGIKGSGLDKLEQSDHDGASIDARIETGYMNFGNPNQKRIRSIVLGGEAESPVMVDINCNESTMETVNLLFSESMLKLSGAKAYSTRFQKGRYFQFVVSNTNGDQFSIEDLTIVALILHTKPKGV